MLTRAYLIECFDVHGWNMFIPSPGLCLDEKDAKRYCKENTTEHLLCSYRQVDIVCYDRKKNVYGKAARSR